MRNTGMTIKVWLFLLAMLGNGLLVTAQTVPATRQYANSKAAIVMVRTEMLAEVNVPRININNKAFNQLLDSIHDLEVDSIFLSPSQKLDIVLNAFNENPRRYFVTAFNYFRHRERVAANGTGFIVSGNGYVITNCHVVDEGDAALRRRFILSAFNLITETNIAAIEQSWALQFNDQQRALLNRTFANVFSQVVPIELEKLEKKIFVLVNKEGSNGKAYTASFPAFIVNKGNSMPGKDVALLRIYSPVELPVLSLSKLNEVAVGEEVLVFGYPSPVTTNEFLSNETVAVPTLTKGIVSALKKSVNGWPVIQMDANINHGNSGGPVCNRKGAVIGITTFGSWDDIAKGLAPGLNFAIPVGVIREFVPDSLTLGKSGVSELFSRSYAFYEKGYYKKALNGFTQLKKMNTDYPGLSYFISNSQAGIDEGRDQEPGSFIIMLAGLGILGLFFLLAYYKFRKG